MSESGEVGATPSFEKRGKRSKTVALIKSHSNDALPLELRRKREKADKKREKTERKEKKREEKRLLKEKEKEDKQLKKLPKVTVESEDRPFCPNVC